MKSYLYFLFIILFFGCASPNTKNVGSKDIQADNSFYTIDFPEILKKQREVPISDIADSIKYIVLETSPRCLLGRILDAKFSKDYVFIKHRGGPLAQFDRTGNFIQYIGSIGRGPQEYDGIKEFSIDEEHKVIYIQFIFGRKISVFSFEGKYIKSINLDQDLGFIVWSRDSLFMCFNEPTIGDEGYVFTEINSKGSILQSVKNFCFWQTAPKRMRFMTLYPGRNVFYLLNRTLHFKGWYNDTIYTYSSNKEIIPKFFVDMGKYRLPDELRLERTGKFAPSDYYWDCIKESSRYVFIRYATYAEALDGKGLFDDGYLYYDKKTGESGALINKNGEIGFVNDLGGGPEFIPEYTTDSLAFHFIESADIKKYLASDKFLKSTPKYPNQKEMLIKQLDGLSGNDNPIIMVVKLK